MKTINKVVYILALLTFSRCSGDFIDIAPISNANEQNFYNTEQDFLNAIYGAYSTLKMSGTYSDNIQLIGDLRSDNTEMGTTASVRFPFYELSEFMDQETSPIVANVWNHHYMGIRRVNTILDRIDDSNANDQVRSTIVAEAKFLRALFYFNLVRVFGDVPLTTSRILTVEDAYEFSRTASNEVYNQIIEDLIAAEEALPLQIGNLHGRATKGAAGSLLGKVYLTIHEYEKAKIVLGKVIGSDQYDILDNFSDLWRAENKNNMESIFDVQFEKNVTASTGAPFTERYTPYLYPHLPFRTTGGGYNIPTEDLIEAFEQNDLRKGASLKESYINTDGSIVSGLEGRYNIKFYDMPIQGGGSGNNWPILRYADVLLMYAEALNEISFDPNGPSFDLLNRIRRRAGLPEKTFNHSDPFYAVNSQEEFRLAIEQERRVELAFEGHRWFDLVRTNRAVDVINPKVSAGVQPHQLLLPIPLSQVQINPENISQNPGY
ncbi:RagB/SusD family nutrient uptake outer membrane protein [Lunatibacter salilacus]|uniref:RagB/SusD family nutrient uptake outer membrane protein n=1 Tax=Lunatibacter salilacus TaxID=2483804 RepID=UPI00131A6D7D|nr:RagB/SusD family nutrient uptake outer membrane protein [Lunatibacter salilacus]